MSQRNTKKVWKHNKHLCVVRRVTHPDFDMDLLTAYISVEKEHPAYAVEYDKLTQLTQEPSCAADSIDGLEASKIDDIWWIGFFIEDSGQDAEEIAEIVNQFAESIDTAKYPARMTHKEMTAHIRKRIKRAGIKASVRKYTSCGDNWIQVSAPSPSIHLTRKEQTQIQFICDVNNLTHAAGMPIDETKPMGDSSSFVFHG